MDRRIQQTTGGSGAITSGTNTTDFFYSKDWQVVAEWVKGSPRTQYMWSPANDVVWVDAMIFRDRDSDSDGSLDERVYVQQDANYNVTSLIDITGAVLKRFVHQFDMGTPTARRRR